MGSDKVDPRLAATTAWTLSLDRASAEQLAARSTAPPPDAAAVAETPSADDGRALAAFRAEARRVATDLSATVDEAWALPAAEQQPLVQRLAQQMAAGGLSWKRRWSTDRHTRKDLRRTLDRLE